MYVVSVSGPKMYKVQRQAFMPRQAENTQLYQIIRIDGGRLRYEARTAVGELYDAFTLVKRSGEINELIEQIPDTPERISTEESSTIDAGFRQSFPVRQDRWRLMRRVHRVISPRRRPPF